MIKNIPINKLLLDPTLQVRPVNQEHLERLINSDVSAWPPLKVVAEEGTDRCFIISGQHRYLAAKQKELHSLECELVEDCESDDQLRLVGYEENMRHGLPLSMHERKEYAKLLKKTSPDLSNREVARRAGIDEKTVRNLYAPQEHDAFSHASDTATIPVSQSFTGEQAGAITAFLDSVLSSELYEAGVSSETFANIAVKHILQEYSPEYLSDISSTLRAFGHGLVLAGKKCGKSAPGY